MAFKHTPRGSLRPPFPCWSVPHQAVPCFGIGLFPVRVHMVPVKEAHIWNWEKNVEHPKTWNRKEYNRLGTWTCSVLQSLKLRDLECPLMGCASNGKTHYPISDECCGIQQTAETPWTKRFCHPFPVSLILWALCPTYPAIHLALLEQPVTSASIHCAKYESLSTQVIHFDDTYTCI